MIEITVFTEIINDLLKGEYVTNMASARNN